MARTIDLGIIGAGWVVGVHIVDTFGRVPGAKVVAVRSRSLERAKAKIAKHGDPRGQAIRYHRL